MRAAVQLVILSCDESGARTGEKTHHLGYVLRRAPAANQGLGKRVMLRLGLARRPWHLHKTGRHHIDAYLAGEFVSQRTREPNQTGLAGDHMGAVCRAGVGAQTSDIDDRGPVASCKMRQAGPRANKGAVQHHAEDFSPFFEGHRGEGLFSAHGCIVHEDVNAAKGCDGRIDHSFNRRRIGHIRHSGYRPAPARLYVAYDGLSLGLIRSGVYDDRGSGACKRSGNRASNIAPGASDDRHPPGKFLIAHVTAFRLVRRVTE
jgi:hypothetical protein